MNALEIIWVSIASFVLGASCIMGINKITDRRDRRKLAKSISKHSDWVKSTKG